MADSKLIAAALAGLLLAGCATQRAPVVTVVDPAPSVLPSQRVHEVVRGDTLYAIAWRYETTVDKLAQLNHLAPPYLIHVGDRLMLDPPVPAQSAAGTATAASGVVVMPVPEPRLDTHPDPRPVVAGTPVPPPAPAAATQAPGSPASTSASGWSWQWPATGDVTRQYDSNGKFKGVNIQSRPGTPIQAAAPGEVVYAGDGLRGYGQLIIVQHSDVYLSAYAYNRIMAVREGDKVAAGQRLGEVGGDAANPGRLYFEIRKQGEPIDPTRLLPSK
ncbi:MAG: peptidoglycan DD-metalloendopeptidase family protein [Porticoccaceae bacterium]